MLRRGFWHQHTQYDIQGPKEIDLFPAGDKQQEEGITFETGEVYTVEVWITNAEDPSVSFRLSGPKGIG